MESNAVTENRMKTTECHVLWRVCVCVDANPAGAYGGHGQVGAGRYKGNHKPSL